MLTMFTHRTSGTHWDPPETIVGLTNGADRVDLVTVPGDSGPAYWTAALAETPDLADTARQLDPSGDAWVAALHAAING